MNRTRALGKGLGALIPQLEEADLQNTLEVPVEKIEINPYQEDLLIARASLNFLNRLKFMAYCNLY